MFLSSRKRGGADAFPEFVCWVVWACSVGCVQLDVEHAHPDQVTPENKWQRTIADINDPKNMSFGDVTYWVVEENVGAMTTFFKWVGLMYARAGLVRLNAMLLIEPRRSRAMIQTPTSRANSCGVGRIDDSKDGAGGV